MSEEKPTYWKCTLYGPDGLVKVAEQSRRGTRASVISDVSNDASIVDARGGFDIEPDESANLLQANGVIA